MNPAKQRMKPLAVIICVLIMIASVVSGPIQATAAGTTAKAKSKPVKTKPKKTTARRTVVGRTTQPPATVAATEPPTTQLPPTVPVATVATVAPSTSIPALVSTIAWTPCGGTFDCAVVQVPMDYANLAGPKIGIALKRAKATAPNPVGSVLINPGGPSGSGVEYVTNRPRLFNPAAREKYSVIGFDPRGVGLSAPLSCGSTRDRSARTSKQYIDAVRDACYNRQPELLRTITTANTARDMEQIRIALGEAKLNYLGVSYGTYLGLVYADLFPQNVGRFIIDSAVDPAVRGIELTAGQYGVYEARVMSFLNTCSASRSCVFGPGAVSRYEGLLTKATTTPFEYAGFYVDRGALESITFAMVRAGRDSELRILLNQLDKGNATALGDLVKLFDGGLPNVNDLIHDPDGDGMYFQVACFEGFHPSSSTDSAAQKFAILTAQAPHFAASATAIANSQACTYWGSQIDTRPIPTPKPGQPPMLFFASVNDNVTPSVWTKRDASMWPGSVYAQVPGAAHGVMSNSLCGNEAGSIFLLFGNLPAPTVCA
jgi:pimeloyl-ACP methyl ester carboxylesterase